MEEKNAQGGIHSESCKNFKFSIQAANFDIENRIYQNYPTYFIKFYQLVLQIFANKIGPI